MLDKIYDKILYLCISLKINTDFILLKIRERKNKQNLCRANSVNNYKIFLTFDSNEYIIVDNISKENIARFNYKEFELIIETTQTISIAKCKNVIRAFFNNPYLQVQVTH